MDTTKTVVAFENDTLQLAFNAMLQGGKVAGLEKTLEELRAEYKTTCAAIRKAVKPAEWMNYSRQVRELFKRNNPKASASDMTRFTKRMSYLRQSCGYPAANGGNKKANGQKNGKGGKPAEVSSDPARLVIPAPAGKTPEAQGRLVLQVLDKLQFRLGMDIDTFVLVVHSALGSIAKREKKTV